MESIAVFVPNWIGDVVMATPAIRALRRHLPEAYLIAVGRPYVADVLAGAPWIDEFLPCDKKSWTASRTLRQRNVQLAILFPNSFRSALTAWMGNCRRRVGYSRYGRGLLLTDRLQPVRNDRGRLIPSPIIHEYNRLVEVVGVSSPGHHMELFTLAADREQALGTWQKFQFQGSEVIGLNPGAAFGAAKFWPIAHFARLAQMLTDRRGARVLVLCGPKETELARQIVAKAQRPTVQSIADEKLSLGFTKALVQRLDLLVTTDSGPRHFAAAFGQPVVTLFGPTHIAWTETYHPQAIHLQKAVPCGPCQLRVCPLDHRCMRDLLPGEVYAACEELLHRNSTTQPRGRHAS